MTTEQERPEINGIDLINAVAYYRAKEAGLIEDIGAPASTYGILGAMVSDIQESVISYTKGEITKETLESDIDKAIVTGFTAIVVKVYETIIEKPLINKIKSKLPPILSNAVDAATLFVKEKIITKGAELIEKGWNWLKEQAKKIFAKT